MKYRQKLIFLLFLGILWMPASLVAQSPYIYKVYDYQPAPGQFVNKLPMYTEGETKEDMITNVEEYITGEEGYDVSLGAWGGYIVFGFDHAVLNVKGQNDFRILGNSHSGSSEPGIVMVSYDANDNGIPDDAWYELAGSEYNKETCTKNYQITYYKPTGNTPTPDPNSGISDKYYIRWQDNQGGEGYVAKNTFHTQSYWPEWIKEETLTFRGNRLADNYTDINGDGSYYEFQPYDWGYADNLANAENTGVFNIEWAVDENGNPVNLEKVHFIKVYTAINYYCGRIGEGSTEIQGAIDLHVDANSLAETESNSSVAILQNPVTDRIILTSDKQQSVSIYNMHGKQIVVFAVENGTNYIPCAMPSGFYILRTENNHSIKFIKQ